MRLGQVLKRVAVSSPRSTEQIGPRRCHRRITFLPAPSDDSTFIYTAHGANWAARGRPISRRCGVFTSDCCGLTATDEFRRDLGSHGHY